VHILIFLYLLIRPNFLCSNVLSLLVEVFKLFSVKYSKLLLVRKKIKIFCNIVMSINEEANYPTERTAAHNNNKFKKSFLSKFFNVYKSSQFSLINE
jgi:hypothetical protein